MSQSRVEQLRRSGIVQIHDASCWPDPTDEVTTTAMWKMIHARDGMTDQEMNRVHRMAEAYRNLIKHRKLSLDMIKKVVSGIRKAIRR